ncbi:ATP-binding protein [Priestia megaterium]|uniref:ATP-binding protein n=1 Tax=Priestia megaterium TaxID=1404 RepID=UPI000682B28C|nr:ATP-binding protein [Priestia megaterium]KNH20302.1 ATP-binding protein [Priestia megaterium]
MVDNSNFLNPGMEQIRKSITDIEDSYNNEWDILAELIQNAVDAIRKMIAEGYKGEITLSINAIEREIHIKDNGIGINPQDVPTLLKPFSSNKSSDNTTVGEKGVGLTFVMFNCNYFKIITGNDEGACEATIEDAEVWKNGNSEEGLSLLVTDIEKPIQGTEVILKQVKPLPFFDLNFNQLKYVLRTRTSIGNTKALWENDIEIDINLEFLDQNGEKFNENIPFKYLMLTDVLNENEKIDLEYFKNNYSDALKTDKEKREALFGKVIYYKGEFTHNNNRKIKYYAYFMPGRAMWDKFSEEWGLITEDKIEDEDYRENYHYALTQPGIYTSVKGMPTGIVVNNPKTGYAGYWSNMFVLFEDSSLKFDIGRKSIHGRQSLILQGYAKEIFNSYLKFITKYVSRDKGNFGDEWDRDEVFGEIAEMVDLNNKNTLFEKSPKRQEAQVCAMFYEQAAKGNIKDLKFLTSGYKGRYDLYAKWGRKKVVIEFKAELKNILRDFNDEEKLFDEIDCIVCWDVSEDDEKVMMSKSITITEIQQSRLAVEAKVFPNATHKLDLGGMVNPIYVIDLKRII